MHTVAELKTDVAGILTGTSLNNVTNLEGALQGAVSTFLTKAYVPEASGRESVVLFNNVFDYGAPATIFGGTLTDLRPVGIDRTELDTVYKKYIEDFDITKCKLPNGYNVAFEYDPLGTPIMRVSTGKPFPSVLLDDMSDDTDWVVSGSIASISEDRGTFYKSPASLRFSLVGASSGYIEKAIDEVDLSDYEGVGSVFLALDIPATGLTSIELRIGSSSSNYYSLTITEDFLGNSFDVYNKFVLAQFDLSQATAVGSPDLSTADYVRITFATSTTLTNMRVGRLFASFPAQHELLFQSSAIFLSGGSLSKTIQTDDDTIILTEPAYNIYKFECAWLVSFQMGGTLASGQLSTIDGILNGVKARNGATIKPGLYDFYRSKFPNEEIKQAGSWY